MKKILVAVDIAESEQVIQALHHLNLGSETKVILAHVVVNTDADPDVAVDRPQAETSPPAYIEILQSYQSSLPCPSELEVVTGEPAEEIVRLANIHQVELIVIGNRGLTGMSRILQGSVSSQVVEDAHCSVLVVKH